MLHIPFVIPIGDNIGKPQAFEYFGVAFFHFYLSWCQVLRAPLKHPLFFVSCLKLCHGCEFSLSLYLLFYVSHFNFHCIAHTHKRYQSHRIAEGCLTHLTVNACPSCMSHRNWFNRIFFFLYFGVYLINSLFNWIDVMYIMRLITLYCIQSNLF